MLAFIQLTCFSCRFLCYFLPAPPLAWSAHPSPRCSFAALRGFLKPCLCHRAHEEFLTEETWANTNICLTQHLPRLQEPLRLQVCSAARLALEPRVVLAAVLSPLFAHFFDRSTVAALKGRIFFFNHILVLVPGCGLSLWIDTVYIMG